MIAMGFESSFFSMTQLLDNMRRQLHFIRLAQIAFVVLCLTSRAAAEIRFAPLISHNMVLQKGRMCRLEAYTTSKKLSVDCRVGKGAIKAKINLLDGRWICDLDFSKITQSGPCTLRFKEGNSQWMELTNVVVGNVWIVAIKPGQGCPIEDWGNLNNQLEKRDKIRFLTITNFANITSDPNLGAITWQSCGTYQLEQDELTILAARLAAASEDFIGIIQSQPHGLLQHSGYLPNKQRQSKNNGDSEPPSWLEGVWAFSNREVFSVAQNQTNSLIHLKHEGKIGPIPTIHSLYDPVKCVSYKDFSDKSPLVSQLEFEWLVLPK